MRGFDRLVDGMGFTIVNACYPMSVDSENSQLKTVYQATATDHIVRFTRREKKMIFKALRDTIPGFRSRIRIFTPRASLNALIRNYENTGGSISEFSAPCQGGINFFLWIQKPGIYFPAVSGAKIILGKYGI